MPIIVVPAPSDTIIAEIVDVETAEVIVSQTVVVDGPPAVVVVEAGVPGPVGPAGPTGPPASPRSVYNSRDYDELFVTIPAPTNAPTMSESAQYAGGEHIEGSTYDVAVTYVGVGGGETLLGPSVSTVCVNGSIPVVLPRAVLGTPAVGAYIYMRKDAGPWYKSRSNPDNQYKIIGFGDEQPSLGGVICVHQDLGIVPPVTSTAVDAGGTAIPDPTLAPRVIVFAGMPLTTFYGAYSYVGQDGAETALSPASSPVTVGARGHEAYLRVQSNPPSGAVFVNVYLSTDGTTWHRQITHGPLSYRLHRFPTYNASGAAPDPSTPHSMISGLQQAIDAWVDTPRGFIEHNPPDPTYDTKVPLNLRGYNSAGQIVQGMAIIGNSGHGIDAIGFGRIQYVGALSGVEMVISCVTAFILSRLDFCDPGSKVWRCFAMYDNTGGGSFNGWVEHCRFEAYAASGIAMSVIVTQETGTHSAADIWFERVIFVGKTWGIELQGGQTLGFRFKDIQVNIANDGTANCGDVRNWTEPIYIDGFSTSADGNYVFYVSDYGGGKADIYGDKVYIECQIPRIVYYFSAMANISPRLLLSRSYCVNQTGQPILLVYAGGPANEITLDHNVNLDGDVAFSGAGGRLKLDGASNTNNDGINGTVHHPTPGYKPVRIGTGIPASVGGPATDLASALTLLNNTVAALKANGMVKT